MNSVAAKRPGATFSIRASSLVLAALATGIPLFLLLLGLSIKTAEAIRESRMSVDLIPIPAPPPPVEEPKPVPARPSEHSAAPAAAEARPASLVDRSPAILPAPPAPASADASATGTTAEGLGTGIGGDGPGGNGDGPIGGTVARAPVRGEASWIYKPDNAALMPFSPQRAGVAGVNGQVLLTCRVMRNRRATDCRVASERPRGYGFGRAAVEASRIFRLNPPTLDGEPDENRRVAIPVTFNNSRR